jgi:hypothetical protein
VTVEGRYIAKRLCINLLYGYAYILMARQYRLITEGEHFFFDVAPFYPRGVVIVHPPVYDTILIEPEFAEEEEGGSNKEGFGDEEEEEAPNEMEEARNEKEEASDKEEDDEGAEEASEEEEEAFEDEAEAFED